MRGLLTAYVSILFISASAFTRLAQDLFRFHLHERIAYYIAPLCVKMLLCTVALLLHCVIALRHKRRVRGDGYFAHAIVEEVYARYLTPRTN